MQENLVVGITFLPHHCCTYLTQAHSVSPTGTDDGEPYGNGGCPIFGSKSLGIVLVNHEGTAVEMGIAERAAYFKLLADSKRLLSTNNFQTAYSSALSPLHRYKVDDIAKVVLSLLGYQSRQFLLGIFHPPAIEVGRFLVIVIKHLLENSLVGGVAERCGRCAYPAVEEPRFFTLNS